MQPLRPQAVPPKAAPSSSVSSLSTSSGGLKPNNPVSSRPSTSAASTAPFVMDPPKKKQTAFLRKSKETGEGGVSSGGGKARCIWVGLPKAFLSLYDFSFSCGSAQTEFERLHAGRDFAQAAEMLEDFMFVLLVFLVCFPSVTSSSCLLRAAALGRARRRSSRRPRSW
jgi:hypothetical protein